MSNPITVAVVGQGRSGWDIHVRRLREDSRFRIIAVADFDADKRRQSVEELGCEAYSDHQTMFRKAGAELVIVSSYSFTHAPVACQALGAGSHVLVEKPIAMNTAWVDRMIAARDASGKKLFPFHNYRYFPEYHYLRDKLSGGPIGEVFEIRIRLLGFSRRNDWQTLREYGGGVLNNTCPHFLDLALQMLGSPVKDVFTDLKLVTNVGDAENHVRIVMRAENGRTADLLVSSVDAFPEPKWTLLGSRGTLVSDGKEASIKCFDPAKASKYEVRRGPSRDRSYDFSGNLPFEEYTEPVAADIPGDVHDNIHAVLREGATQDIMIEDVREVVRISELARRKDGFYGDASRKVNPEA